MVRKTSRGKYAKRLFSLLLLLAMLFDAAPVAVLAENMDSPAVTENSEPSEYPLAVDVSEAKKIEADLPQELLDKSNDYSKEGSVQILLSELISQYIALGIEMPAVDVAEVVSVVFTGEHAVSVQQVSGLIAYNNVPNADAGEKDFLLTSVDPFSTEEEITITLKSGETIEIGKEKEPVIEEEHTLAEGEYTCRAVEDPSGLIELINPPLKNTRGFLRAAAKNALWNSNQQEIGYAAYEIELTESTVNAKKYQLTVPVSVDMLENRRDTEQDIIINSVQYQLYHIHTDEEGNTAIEEITPLVDQENGVIPHCRD